MYYSRLKNNSIIKPENKNIGNFRLRVLVFVFIFFSLIISIRLFYLMVIQYDFYEALAAGSHEIYNNLHPKRGLILIQDSRSGEEYVLAMNYDKFLVYADTRKIKNNETAEMIMEKISEIFSYNDEQKASLLVKLNKREDPYEPIENKVEESVVEIIKEMNLPGINFIRQPFRYYPEGNLASTVVGFLGKDINGNDIGRYGIEGYWQKELAGSGGFVKGSRTALGNIIPAANMNYKKPINGADLLLTIDRTLEYKACEILKNGLERYKAKSASLIIMDPSTGAIRAMCSFPDFDPNNYGKVENIEAYNNTNIFTAYEPGSIFKPITMAAALNEGVIGVETTFLDTGSRTELCKTPIKNAMSKVYGVQDMNSVLKNSINTGMIFVVEKLGKNNFLDYLNAFGFGLAEGIELDKEVSGNIKTLYENKKNKVDCYTATASFGQGITVTPLQMAVAYSTIANGGIMMKPYIVEEIRYADGKIERTRPTEIRKVLDKKTALTVSGMLVNVVDKGHPTGSSVNGYYIGGKTGTAQIPGPGGYLKETNHSFVGIAPIFNPKFVMIVKFEKPQMTWADSTALPVFNEISKFALQYYQIPPER